MDEDASIGVKIHEFISRNLLFVILIFIGLGLCGFGVYQYISSKESESNVKLIKSEDTPVNTSITVHVEGEVIKPGVYKLEKDPRIQDAIDAAGGVTGKADSSYISKRVNLAQKITDGSKIYIPAIGEIDDDTPVIGSNQGIEQAVAGIQSQETGIININTASQESLETLPRIGPVTAQKIISGRPYGSIEELVAKKVLGQKTFDGLRSLIVAQ